MRESGGSRDQNNRSEVKKKPFDKRKYRLQKYSNKFKVDQWEERRKKNVIRSFYKDLEKDEKSGGKKNFNLKNGSLSKNKKNPFLSAREEFQKKKEEKKRRKEETLRKKAEKEEALKKYKEKRMHVYKKLSKKTRKGQPVMKDRMELLFEKIKKSTQN